MCDIAIKLPKGENKMLNIVTGAVALGLLWGIVTLGVYLTFRILDMADMSCEGSITLGGATAAVLITCGFNPWIATLIAMCAGFCAGLVTGVLHTKLKIPILLSGILTMTALYSINLRIMGRANVPLSSNGSKAVDTVFTPLVDLFKNMVGDYDKNDGMSWLYDVITNKNFAALILGLIVVVIVSVIIYWFFGTEIGSAIRATGNNHKMVRAQGIHTSTMIILGLVISNGLIALAGALIAQYQAFADVQMGIGSIVIGLASLIIGEVIIGTKSFHRVLVALPVGAVIYRMIIALVMNAGMEANDLKLFTSITVTFCLSLPLIKKGINKLIKKRNGGEPTKPIGLEPVLNGVKPVDYDGENDAPEEMPEEFAEAKEEE